MLHNGGPSALEYELDLSPLEALKQEHYGAAVLRLASPSGGVIPPGGCALLRWVLAPVEAREVVVDLPVAFSNGKSDVLSIMGRGYHPEDGPPSEGEPLPGERGLDLASWRSFSPLPGLWLPGALAQLSADVLSMGSQPLASLSRRLVLVANSWDLPIAFAWDLGHLAPSAGVLEGTLSVTPVSGTLEPGERVMCQVVYASGVAPEVWEGQIACEVEPTPEAVEANNAMTGIAAAGTARGAATTVGTLGETAGAGGEEEEEVIAVHPQPPTGRIERLRAPGSQRLPLHVATTATVRNQKPLLGDATMDTLTRLESAAAAAGAPRPVPAPQRLLLHLHGRALGDRQLEAGVCCVPSEAAAAAEAAAATGWRKPTVEPLVAADDAKAKAVDAGPWGRPDSAMAAALEVLTGAILEAVSSPELAAAVAELEEAAVPRFAQVSDAAGAAAAAAGEVQPAPPLSPPPMPPPPHIPVPSSTMAAPPVVDLPTEAPTAADDANTEAEEGHDSAAPKAAVKEETAEEEEEEEEGADVAALRAKPELQVFAEFVLESALFGLLAESADDEWDGAEAVPDEQ